MNIRTTVLQVGGLNWATSASIVEQTLLRRPGVLAVEANAVSQTANVTFDPDRTGIAQLSGWIRDCGHHRAGQSVPEHVCDPMTEPAATTAEGHEQYEGHEGHDALLLKQLKLPTLAPTAPAGADGASAPAPAGYQRRP